MMDLNLLSIFVAVAETRSFSAAARRLEMPKSSVSRGVSSLEEHLGVRLLHRTTRQVTLSTAGTALFDQVAPLLGALEKSVTGMPELEQEPSGELRVTAAVDFGTTVLAELASRFMVRHPAVQVRVNVTNRVVDLVAEGFDLGFRISMAPLKDSSLMARKASPLGMQLFASPTYLARRGAPRTPHELASHEWVVFGGYQLLRLEGPDGATEIEVRGRLICDDTSFAQAAVRAGVGIGVLPSFLAEADLAAGRLVRVLPEWKMRAGHHWIVWPGADHLPRKVTAFRDFVLEALKAKPLMPAELEEPGRSA